MRTGAAGILLCACVLLARADEVGTASPPPPKQYPPGAAAVVGAVYAKEDGLRFVHCPTHAPYPIARQSAYEELERALAAVPREPGAPVIVSLMARLQPMPIVEGRPPRDQMIVDGVLRVWPDETCEKVSVKTPLANTYWKVVELNGAPVATHENQKEVYLLLRHDSDEVRGFAGCNRLTGRYQSSGSLVRFVGLTAGGTACPYREEEHAFLKALERVTSYQIVGESLDLRDDAGSIARCRAIYF